MVSSTVIAKSMLHDGKPSDSVAEKNKELRKKADPDAVEGMRRYGISSKGTLGVSVSELRRMAKGLGRSHSLALDLWQSGIHEARILAIIVDEPSIVSEDQMESWVMVFDYCDFCD